MPSLAVRTDDGKALTVEKNNVVVAAVQTWNVGTNDLVAAQTDSGVPKQGDSHPEYPELSCDDVTFSWNAGSIDANVRYSKDGRFSLNVKSNRVVGWYEWTSDYREFEVKLPYSALVKVRVPSTGTLVNTYVLKSLVLKERRVIRIFKALLLKTNALQFDAANDEVGYIHRIRGNPVKMLGFSTNEPDDKTVMVTYEWMIDKGTPKIPSITDGGSEFVRFAPATNAIPLPRDDDFIRNPYEKLEGSERGGSEQPLIFGLVDAEGFHDNGPNSLPGYVGPT